MSNKMCIFAAFFIKCEYNAYALHIRHSQPTKYLCCHMEEVFTYLASAVIL